MHDRIPRTTRHTFTWHRGGNFSINFALMSTLIFLAAGLAVDYAHSLTVRMRISNAVDAAVLATGRAISNGEIDSEDGDDAKDYFKVVFAANLGRDEFDAGIHTLENFAVDADAGTVSAEVSFNKPLYFLQVATDETKLKVVGSSSVLFRTSLAEVAMVLDVTSSMDGIKLDNLKKAAKQSVETLLSTNGDTDNVRVSIVPYHWAVNAGPLAKYVYPDWDNAKSDAPVYDADYDAGYDVKTHLESFGAECTDDGSGSVSCTNIPAGFQVNSDGTSVDDCATDRKAPESGDTSYQYTDENPSKGMISRDSRLARYLHKCPTSPIVLLTSDESALKSAIDNLTAASYTAGHIGLQWGWYTISHKWADFIDGTNSDPQDATTTDDLEKVIILMTDGIFNTAYADVPPYGLSPAGMRNLIKTHTEKLCTNIKAQGIKIFTVGYDTPADADSMLKGCATPNEGSFTYSYEADTAAELIAAFKKIAARIHTLRLSQ